MPTISLFPIRFLPSPIRLYEADSRVPVREEILRGLGERLGSRIDGERMIAFLERSIPSTTGEKVLQIAYARAIRKLYDT